MALKLKRMVVEQRPLLVEGEPGFDPKRRLLNPNAEPAPIGEYMAVEECDDAELLAHMQEHYGCTEAEAVEKMVDAARRQYNTDRRNAIASDHLNGGTQAMREARVNEIMERVTQGLGTPEDFAALKEMALKSRKRK